MPIRAEPCRAGVAVPCRANPRRAYRAGGAVPCRAVPGGYTAAFVLSRREEHRRHHPEERRYHGRLR